MKTIEVQLKINIPELYQEPTLKDITEWVHFNTGYGSTISLENPLVELELNEFIQSCMILG